MLRRSLPLILVCLFLASTAIGQTLDQDLTTFEIDGHTAVVKLGIVGPSKNTYSIPIHLELLDMANVERASATITEPIRPGKQMITVRMELGDLAETEGDDLMWFRLRWAVGETRGITPLTDIFDDNFSLRISSAGWLTPGHKYRIFVEAVDPRTDDPISGVELTAVFAGEKKDESKIELTASGTTGTDGSAFLDIDVPDGLVLDDSDIDVSVTGTRKGLTITADDDIGMLARDWRFLMATDKPLFQPGQVMHVRGMLLSISGGNAVAPGREVELRIEDEDDTLLFRKKLVTSAFGVASAEWQIPANAKLGGYTITAVAVGEDDDDPIGRLTTKVARYDLPNFLVDTTTDKKYYLPADKTAEITVSADYIFGKPVPKGKVRIVEELDREWNWSKQVYDFKEGRTIEGETNADGKFTTKFDIAEQIKDLIENDHKDASGYSERTSKFDEIYLTAYFTDAATNRTEQRRFDIRISREPIHIYVSDNNLDHINGLPSRIYVAAFYPDGTPAECDIDISISEEDRDEYTPLTRVRTNKYGLAVFELLRPDYKNKDADVDIHFKATDADGNTALYKEEMRYYGDDDGLHFITNKTIYKPGEDIHVSVISTLDDTRLIVQVFNKDRHLLNTSLASLIEGKANIIIPYEPAFSGKVFIAVYSPADNDSETGGVIYPKTSGIKVEASFDKAVYKPGEEGSLAFVVTDADGSPVEAALGVSVFDKAVSLRATADGGGSVISDGFSDVIGSGGRFGTITIDDINRIDLSKPIPKDLDLVAERLLHGAYVYIGTFSSSNYDSNAKQVFAKYFNEQMNPFKTAMDKWFKEKEFDHATDRSSFDRIAAANGLDLEKALDPWDEKYYVKFGFNDDKDTINIYSNGLDRKAETHDDILTLSLSYTYFDKTGKAIDQAIEKYHQRTGKFIRDRESLLRELGVNEMKDRYGNPYLFDFSVNRQFYVTTITSLGKDGRPDSENKRGDDFRIWSSRINYASDIQDSIRQILETSGEKPITENEFRSLLAKHGMPISGIRDGYGSPVYLNVRAGSRYTDQPRVVITRNADEKEARTVTKFTPVTQDFVGFDVRSIGPDSKIGTADDFTLSTNVVVLRTISKDERFIERYVLSDEGGSLFIVTKDPQGAVIPGVEITVNGEIFSKRFTTDKTGSVRITGLQRGIYTVTAQCKCGFAETEITNVPVIKDTLYNLTITMNPIMGEVTVVDVTDTSDAAIDATESYLQTNIVPVSAPTIQGNKKPKLAGGFVEFTPRLREYFPETLLWRPDLITGADGRVTTNFKMADNITTWQMYAIASDRSGRVAVVEGETSAFRPFFIDLDPPRYLTAGDVISLPVQIRNYTEAEQTANVTMAKGDWFSIRGEEHERLAIPAGSSENAVFTFSSDKAIDSGKQRVTAIAGGDSDAVEKTVSVSPNGKKIVRSESAVFSGKQKFEIDVPSDAIENTAKAEIKLYPDLFAHIVESQSGLLRRPVGCGEQVISAAYPNLMILRFPNANAKLKQKALRDLQEGYEKLVGYRAGGGGFTYWGGNSKPSIALTAYAVRFLIDAKEFIAVDEDVVEDAEKWLLKRAQPDGWHVEYELPGFTSIAANRALTTYVVRTLAMLKPEPKSDAAKNLEFGLGLVRGYSDQFEEPYRLALYGLAAFDTGKNDEARRIAETLAGLALTEGDGEYWNLETNTVFYGWGMPGRIETTALALQLLSRVDRERYAGHIAKGLVFLLKNKDRYGVWYSTQTTVNVLDCFLELMRGTDTNAKTAITIKVNGRTAKEFRLEQGAIEQQTADVSAFLRNGKNSIEIVADQNSSIMAQAVAEYYAEWKNVETSPTDVTGNRALTLSYDCGSGNAAIMDTITCTAAVERIGFKGYGMLMAELGVPPGADIDRSSLDQAMMKDPSISRYEILPDRIIVYLYAKPGGTTFSFTFRPRYAINALAPASAAYDYYNPLARAETEPIRFIVK